MNTTMTGFRMNFINQQLAKRLSILSLLLAGFSSQLCAQSITIGQGPSIGFAGGTEYFEEFQDWTLEDCLALDPHSDSVNLGGGENARDLVALYVRDEPASNSVYFRVDLMDLFIAAEDNDLNIYLLIDTGTPGSGTNTWPDGITGLTGVNWEVAVALYSVPFWNIYDASGTSISSQSSNQNLFRGSYFRSDLDAIEFGIDRQVLLDRGWNGSTPLNLQVGTAKDFSSTLTDALPDSGSISSDSGSPTAKYAFVLHGNQAISPADYIQTLVYSDVVITPNGNPTGYRRALETARVFQVPANIHVSATLLSSALWAADPGQPDDGPGFVQEIKNFIDGDPSNGEGSIIAGVYSEHIMPFFEGDINIGSIEANNEYLNTVLGTPFMPTENTVFWIPERVVRGSTFEDLLATDFQWTILDQVNHLRSWFGNDDTQGHKIHRINEVNTFMINDEPDRFKFANTDGGLWIDTRRELLKLALDEDQEQLTLVFDDWEAYAGRSFLSFNQGSDNPDNFNTNIRWLANHPWIQVVNLEDVASWNWTPVVHPLDLNLPFETYDFLDFATEDSYENWYQGSGLEEDFDGFRPFIRFEDNSRTVKPFGAVSTYIPSNGANIVGGPGTIAQDVYQESFLTSSTAGSNGQLNYYTAIFETAWHDEDNAIRCPDGTYCNPDNTFNNIADFARQLQFLNLRRGGGIFARARAWNDSLPAVATNSEFADIDHDNEDEFLLYNDQVFLVFENDGGRLIAAFTKNPATGEPYSLISNLLGFPDRDDEWEADTNTNGRRHSGLVDWYATGLDTNQYVNNLYNASSISNGFRFQSLDGNISKSITLEPNSFSARVDYTVAPSVNELYVRFGLAPDLINLLETGQSALSLTDDGSEVRLTNTASNQFVGIRYSGSGLNTNYNTAASDGTTNSPRNKAMIHMIELEGTEQNFSFEMTFTGSGVMPSQESDLFIFY